MLRPQTRTSTWEGATEVLWMMGCGETGSPEIYITGLEIQGASRGQAPKPSPKAHLNLWPLLAEQGLSILDSATPQRSCQFLNWSQAGGNPKITRIWLWNMFLCLHLML